MSTVKDCKIVNLILHYDSEDSSVQVARNLPK